MKLRRIMATAAATAALLIPVVAYAPAADAVSVLPGEQHAHLRPTAEVAE